MNAGEFSPLMAGRTDIKYYEHACRKIRNFIISPQGPARRRPGTRYVAEVKDSAARTWLWRFEFNIEQAYVLEFGHLYVRFFSNHGVVGAPYEVATPYTTANLTNADGTFALRFVQSGDVLYICHPDYAPRKLTRTGAATFTLAAMAPYAGPFQDVDPDATITVYSSANTGVVTLTASSAIFLAGHVGTDFFLEQKAVDAIKQWEVGKAIGAGNVRRSDGKNYSALNAATTGSIKPVHSYGARYDGDAGVQWQFDDPGYGWATITAIGGGGTTATATVVSRIPDGAVGVGNATNRWALSAWSGVDGYPDNVTFFRERLAFARDRQIWQSVSGDFENFQRKDDGGLVTADMSIVSDITSDKANRIEWLAPSDTALLIGTAGDEHAMSEISTTEPFGPANAKAKKQSEYGSRHIPVCRVGAGVIFVQKSGRKVRDMMFAESVTERWVSSDTTVLAEHITRGGIIDMAYQQEPDSVVWCARSDGVLLGFTLNREQDVRGWHPHRIGGYSNADQDQYAIVESIISIPAPDGDRDELWMIVRRYVNGAAQRYVEWMEYHYEEGDDPESIFYVDSGLSLDNTKAATLTPGAGATVKGSVGVVFTAGSAIFSSGDVSRHIVYRYYEIDITGKIIWKKATAEITTYTDTTHVVCTINSPWPNLTAIASGGWKMTVTSVSGLGHLEGQTVQVCADGAAHPDCVVTAGAISLQWPVSRIHVGLSCPAVIQPMPINAGAQDGTSMGKTQRISKVGIRFDNTIGAKYGADETAQMDVVLTRGGGDNMDEALPLFTGIKTVSWPDGYDNPALITIVQDQPLPCTVVSLMPQMATQDAR
jgi:hypothetical protein